MIEQKRQQKIDDMQNGYSHMMMGEPVSACIEWGKVWEAIVALMEEQHYENIGDVDNEFTGQQSIFNWASDYELELGNATIDDISYAQKRIEFCSEYIFRYHDKSHHNIGCMKRAIAESYFRLGKKDEGENLFKIYLEETPTWGFGWIGWSEEYWLSAKS